MTHPPCHGSPAIIAPTSTTCGACPELASCYSAAVAMLREMDDDAEVRRERQRLQALGPTLGWGRVGVTVSKRGVVRQALQGADLERLQALPERARATARRLLELGWFKLAREQLARGLVPEGVEGSRFEVAVCLLRRGAFCRQDLVEAYLQTGISLGSAQVEATTAITVLKFGGLVTSQDSLLTLSGN